MIKSSFRGRIETLIFENKDSHCLDVLKFLKKVQPIAIKELSKYLQKHTAIKFNLELFGEYVKLTETDEDLSIKSFQSKMDIATNESQLGEAYRTVNDQIVTRMDEFEERNSGWALVSILFIELNINKYKPWRGTSYIPLPKNIEAKKACVNIKNEDEYCFKWAVISALQPVVCHNHANRMSSYSISDITASIITLSNNLILNFSNLNFPLSVCDISVFEKLNSTISVNVFGLEGEEVVGPFYCTKKVNQTHVNLLLLQDNGKSHYVWIKNISRLVRKQITGNKNSIFICNYCLLHFSSERVFDKHQRDCNRIVTKMPSLEERVVKFKKFERSVQVPFVIYADFECILQNVSTCLPNPLLPSTTNLQEHIPCAFAYYIKCSYDNSLNKLQVYRGQDSPQKFIRSLVSDVTDIFNTIIMNPKKMNPLTEEEKKLQNDSTECWICKDFLEENRVADHCHLTGNYRGPAHNECNLRYRTPKFFPIFFHNLSGYDCHLFVKELNQIEGAIDLIPLNKELYISISKRIAINYTETIELRFLDSARFMQSSLEKLAEYMPTKEFHSVRSIFNADDEFELLTRKGVLPYEYIDSWKKLDETALPSKIQFDNKLTNEQCSEVNYKHAKKVWEKFKCETLWDYLKIYLITDVLLLTDIFENFRKICYKIYSLDPCQYYSAPGLSWESMLKYTGAEVELLTDFEMYAFIKKGIRGGITQCSHRHSLANNKYMENYDSTKKSSYLMYLDVNNLYGWAMGEPLPYGGFKWVNNIDEIDIMNISENSEIGYIFEVDLEYGKDLHEAHNDLPFCAENMCAPGSKFSKLIPNLNNKTEYVIHYRNLQQCLRNGLKLGKIHRVLQFNQSRWLERYIQLNTHHRAQATNEFEEQYFKLNNNVIYGKTMESVDKRKDVRMATQWDNKGRRLGARSLIAKPNFHSATQFTPDMVAIQLNRVKTFYNKPMYLGFVILELSKWLMYEFHYEYMRPKYGQNLILDYMDTDSFIYTIFTEDFYSDIKDDVVKRFDTSNYSSNNIYNIPLLNKRVVGLLKDENRGKIMIEFIGLRSKMYSTDVHDNVITKKAKGIKKPAVDKLKLEDYRDCLYKKKIFYSNMLVFRSKIHHIYTQNLNKISLSYLDDKRFIREDGISTYAWGHYKIKDHSDVDDEKNE